MDQLPPLVSAPAAQRAGDTGSQRSGDLYDDAAPAPAIRKAGRNRGNCRRMFRIEARVRGSDKRFCPGATIVAARGCLLGESIEPLRAAAVR